MQACTLCKDVVTSSFLKLALEVKRNNTSCFFGGVQKITKFLYLCLTISGHCMLNNSLQLAMNMLLFNQ